LDAGSIIASSPHLSEAIRLIESGVFSDGDGSRFAPLINALRYSDYYMVTADFDAYFDTQRQIDRLWQSPSDWMRMSIRNIANMAWFSSDRTISEYASDIWNVPIEQPKGP
jgi:starch phosphorylase